MLGLGAPELVLILIAMLLLFGYKKLPDASRSIGRSLRIFKGEMKGMKDDDSRESVRTKDAAQTTPVRTEIGAPTTIAGPMASSSGASASGDLTARLEEEARIAEARAAELRARVEQSRSADGSH